MPAIVDRMSLQLVKRIAWREGGSGGMGWVGGVGARLPAVSLSCVLDLPRGRRSSAHIAAKTGAGAAFAV